MPWLGSTTEPWWWETLIHWPGAPSPSPFPSAPLLAQLAASAALISIGRLVFPLPFWEKVKRKNSKNGNFRSSLALSTSLRWSLWLVSSWTDRAGSWLPSVAVSSSVDSSSSRSSPRPGKCSWIALRGAKLKQGGRDRSRNRWQRLHYGYNPNNLISSLCTCVKPSYLLLVVFDGW